MRFLFLFLCFPLGVFAQKNAKSISLNPLPFAYYQTETSLAFGGLLVGFFRLNKQDTVSRISSFSTSLTYTLRNQIVADLSHIIFTKNENYLMTGRFSYSKFPLYYFGVGNQANNADRVLVDQQSFNWFFRAYRKISSNIFLGLEYNFNYLFNVFPRSSTHFEPHLKQSEGRNSGFGVLFVRDSRDNLQSAKTGSYQEISINSYHPIFGSQHSYFSLRTDIRHFFALSNTQTLALQFVGLFTEGDFVPFHRQALIGGELLMRGYYNGRFRDNDMVVLQAEDRIEFGRRWGMVVFGGIGGVSGTIRNFGFDNVRFSGGLGLRFAINPKNRLKVRLDFGFSPEGFGIYSGLSEIF